MNLQIQFLGTGTSQGVPFIGCLCPVCQSSDPRDNRLRSSVWVRSAQTSLIIDTGPDFRYQMLRAQVPRIDGILFTHGHKDHVAGLDDVRAYNHLQKQAIDTYATQETQEVLKREFSYIFHSRPYPGIPQINLHTLKSGKALTIGDIPIEPIRVWHLGLEVLGFRMGDFTYVTDANRIDPEEKEKIKGSRVLVLNALRKEKHISHFHLEEAINLARELEVPQTYFTHIGHQMGTHAEVSRELPAGIALAWDGLEIQVNSPVMPS